MNLPDDVSEEDIKKLQESPAYFVNNIILPDGEEVYPYQEKFLESDNRRKIFVAGRQIGKTTTLCWLALHKAVTQPRSNIFILAPSNRQAKSIVHRKLKSEIPEWIENPDQYGISHETVQEIEFSNGSIIKGLPAANQSNTGETLRGFTVDLILCDEGPFIDDDFYTSVLKPMLFHTQGDIYIFGSAWGKTGYFYERFMDDNWFSIRVSAEDNPNILQEDIEESRREMTQQEFQREVLAEFTQNKNAAIPASAIKACTYSGEDFDDIYPEFSGGKCWLGVDPARYGEDRSFYTLLDDEGNIFKVVHQDRSSSPDIKGIIRQLNDDYHFEKILIDATGFGGGPFDDLEAEISTIGGMEWTLKSKQNVYQTLIKEMEQERITIPDKREFLDELHDMERETTPRGKIKFHAPSGGHDDFPDSLALAVWARRGNAPVERATDVYSFGNSERSSRKKPSYVKQGRQRYNVRGS